MFANRSVAVAVSIALALTGCATASKDIASAYVSPNQYSSYDCQQLAAETGRIQARVVQLGGRLDQAAQNDAGIMAVGLILFWPVLFALGGTKQQEAEYARLKGEYDAVEQAAIAKKCAHVVPAGQMTAQVPAATSAVASTSAATPAAAPSAAPASPEAAMSAPPVVIAQAAPSPSQSMAVSSTESKYLFNAQSFATDSGCVQPAATLSIRAPGYEIFTVACSNGDHRSIRCDYGHCRELK